MIKRKFFGKKLGGRFVFRDRALYDAYFGSLEEGVDLELTVAKKRKNRSIPQNSWYWGAILPVISRETGHTCEELHEIFKRMFLPRKMVVYKDKEIQLPGTTTECDTLSFSTFIEHVRAEAASMGITIPEPGEYAE